MEWEGGIKTVANPQGRLEDGERMEVQRMELMFELIHFPRRSVWSVRFSLKTLVGFALEVFFCGFLVEACFLCFLSVLKKNR